MLACFGWIWLACLAPETRMPDERAPVMTLEVVSSPASPANLLIRVRNGGDAPVWWNARALLNAPHAPAAFRELWLEVTADDGTEVPFNCKVNAGEAKVEDYELLAPGAVHDVAVDLEYCYALARGGRFRVVAHYRDGTPSPPPAPPGAVALTRELVSAPVMLGLPAHAAAASSIGAATRKPNKALEEAEKRFTYREEPIHPDLVKEFQGWASDHGPITITVDVAAAFGTNEYGAASEVRDGWVRSVEEQEYFEYRRLGVLADGTHVLRTAHWSGGSGVFMDLYFVRFSSDDPDRLEGQSRERLLMTVVGHYSLGDRDDGAVTVEAERVVIGPSRHRDAPAVLSLRPHDPPEGRRGSAPGSSGDGR